MEQIQIIGESFKAWADAYFTEDIRLNDFVGRREAYEAYNNQNKGRITPQGFIKRLESWCQLMSYNLNPEEFHNSSKRIIRKNAKGDTEEMIFIRTAKGKKEELSF